MGQFDRFIERTWRPPSIALRVVGVVAPVFMVVQAVGTRRLEDVLTAVWFVALLLPAGIAPKAYYARLARLDNHPAVSAVLMFLLFACGSFVLLTDVIARTPSAVVAVPFALILTAVSVVRSRRRV